MGARQEGRNGCETDASARHRSLDRRSPSSRSHRPRDRPAHRTPRIALGPQAYPSYPGSDQFEIRPMFDLDRARGDAPFEFEAPDDSFALSLIDSGGIELGPVFNFEGTRTAKDV